MYKCRNSTITTTGFGVLDDQTPKRALIRLPRIRWKIHLTSAIGAGDWQRSGFYLSQENFTGTTAAIAVSKYVGILDPPIDLGEFDSDTRDLFRWCHLRRLDV